MTQKTTSDNERIVERDDFLRALYPNPPAELWLELRCIHPETGKVRAFWVQIGDEKRRQSVLKQADKLNSEGFGVYFAPCLRKEKKGNVASAALLPALWVDVDCDGDEVKRDRGLAKLHDFNPPLSAIVDSGGGWHGYWLLNEPLILETDEDKQRIAHVLHGLFAALDGDEAYVKSVASVMRLPGSTNTKPERKNAPVQVAEWCPERRHPLTSFDWLAVKPQHQNGHTPMFSTNGNGQHPLPPRTEGYLASGMHNGSRNVELFAAACQIRDAGCCQGDAERSLSRATSLMGTAARIRHRGRKKRKQPSPARSASRPENLSQRLNNMLARSLVIS